MSGLIAHVDTKRATREQVLTVETPPRTATWGVVGHDQLLDSLTKAVEEVGYKILTEDYSLSKDGGKLFGAFTLDGNSGDMNWMIGFRNSINKSMAVGITAGTRVLVCDNMAFSGSFIRFRKHTGGLTLEELQDITQEAVTNIQPRLRGFEDWHNGLKDYELSRQDMEALTFRAVERGVLAGGRFGAFHKLLFEKKNDDNAAVYGNDLYGFHGAMTQLWKNNSLIGSGSRHAELQKLLGEAQEELNTYQIIRNEA